MPPSQSLLNVSCSGTQIYLPNIWSAVFNKALIFITSGKMCMGFILSGNHFTLLYLHFALHLDVTCSMTRVLGTFFFPEPMDCTAMASSPATCAEGCCSASLSPPSIPHFALCQWLLSHKRSLLLHMTSGLNRLAAAKFVNVCLGRCTSQKHVWITTAGEVQFNTTWVLPTHEFTTPCQPHSAQCFSSVSICHNLFCMFPICPTHPALQRACKSQPPYEVTAQRGRLCNFHAV